jgi:hypothetical protein
MDIMMRLGTSQLSLLHGEWENSPDGLLLDAFVQVMLK